MSGIIRFKFRNAIAYESVLFDGHVISIAEVKRLILEKKGLSRDVNSELELTDPNSNEVYDDPTTQLPSNATVLVKRVPIKPKLVPGAAPVLQKPKPSPVAPESKPVAKAEDEFGSDVYAQARAEFLQEEEQIHTAVEQAVRQQVSNRPVVEGRGRGRGRAGPGRTYICHRCQQPGHDMKHCPTLHDPTFDVKRVRAPAGIPITKLQRSQQGALLLPNGDTAALAANEAAFQQVMSFMPSSAVEASKVGTKAKSPEPVKEDAAPPVSAPTIEETPSPTTSFWPEAEESGPKSTSQGQQPPSRASPAPVPLQSRLDHEKKIVQVPEEPVVLKDLFDDDDYHVPVQAVKLSTGMEQHPQEDVAARAGITSTSGRDAFPSPSPAEEISKSKQLSSSPVSFQDYLPYLAGVLPRGPIKVLIKAFGGPYPLERGEFKELQYDLRGEKQPIASHRESSRQSDSLRHTASLQRSPSLLQRSPSPPVQKLKPSPQPAPKVEKHSIAEGTSYYDYSRSKDINGYASRSSDLRTLLDKKMRQGDDSGRLSNKSREEADDHASIAPRKSRHELPEVRDERCLEEADASSCLLCHLPIWPRVGYSVVVI